MTTVADLMVRQTGSTYRRAVSVCAEYLWIASAVCAILRSCHGLIVEMIHDGVRRGHGEIEERVHRVLRRFERMWVRSQGTSKERKTRRTTLFSFPPTYRLAASLSSSSHAYAATNVSLLLAWCSSLVSVVGINPSESTHLDLTCSASDRERKVRCWEAARPERL